MENTSSKKKISFPASENLIEQIYSLFAEITENPEGKEKRIKLAAIINEMFEQGMDYYFVNSLKIINLGVIARKSIETGVSTVKKTVKFMTKKFVLKMNDTQVQKTAEFIKNTVG